MNNQIDLDLVNIRYRFPPRDHAIREPLYNSIILFFLIQMLSISEEDRSAITQKRLKYNGINTDEQWDGREENRK